MFFLPSLDLQRHSVDRCFAKSPSSCMFCVICAAVGRSINRKTAMLVLHFVRVALGWRYGAGSRFLPFRGDLGVRDEARVQQYTMTEKRKGATKNSTR